MTDSTSSRAPIAVVGVSALFPGSVEETGFWKDILRGSDLMTDVPAGHWLIEDYYDPDPSVPDKTYAKRGAFLPDVDFDAMAWGVPPNIVPETDTSQLLALIVAQRVLADACQGSIEDMDRSRTSVILGVTSGQELLGSMVSRLQRPIWLKALRETGIPEDEAQAACDRISANYTPWTESTFPGLLGNVVAGRIANRLDLGGTNCVTDAACASTFSALQMGVNELALGDSDLVISGGVDTMNDIFMYMCFSKTPALSPTGDCRPFSDQADGTMLGEGIGMVALKRLADAERDGDRIYCVINGLGSSSDGRAKSVYAPRPEGQSEALRRAYAIAGFGPDTVELLEAHGTGTKAGDAAEFKGLSTAFAESGRQDPQWCALGSVKSQIGHAKAAAGAAGLFKAVMSLHHKVLPPTIKVERPNPNLDIETSPFNLTTRARPWVRDSNHPRRAAVSSFGFGGSNFHLALSEYTPQESRAGRGRRAERLRAQGGELVVLGGANGAEVASLARTRSSEAAKSGYLTWLARTSQAQFNRLSQARLALVAKDEADLARKLEQAADLIDATPDQAFVTPAGIHYGVGSDDKAGLAFLFSGQGSQYLDMGNDLAMHFDAAMSAWDASADFDWEESTKLHDVVFPKTAFDDASADAQAQKLSATQWAQPAIGCTSLAQLSLLGELGLEADCHAGHSFGEISALHAAGVFSRDDFLRVARKRGELMNEAAVTSGAMLAVSEPIERVSALLESLDTSVVIANHNAPEQVVLSGETQAVEAVELKLAEEGIKGRRLPVATAFHSPVVAAASGAFGAFLEEVSFSAPKAPVYSNTTGVLHATDASSLRGNLAEQLAKPVRFVAMVEAMYEAGIRHFVEVGPGSVLTGLVGRILGERQHLAVSLDRKGRDGVQSFFEGLAALVAAGRDFDFDALWSGYGEPANPNDRVEPKLTLQINGSNYGKPYPPQGGAAELPAPNPPRPATPTPVDPAAAVRASEPARGVDPVTPSPVHQSTPPASFVAAPAAAAPAVTVASQSPAWIEACQEAQRQTAEAHSIYLQAMAQTHTAYLESIERSLQPMAPVVAAAATTMQQPTTALVNEAPVVKPVQPPHIPAAPSIAPAPAPAPAPVALPAPLPAPTNDVDLHALLLDVVSEKTGYPPEMLTLEMALEGDLGIDSIKRVEILSAMNDAVPGLPEVDTAAMAKLQTLGEVVDYMNGLLGSAGAAAAPQTSTPSNDVDLHALLLDVVSEKTGYPPEMLTLEMALEGDLGIDSIKRVEILSAMNDAVPGLPEVDTAAMAKLQTLGEVVDYMNGLLGSAGAVAAAAPQTSAPSNDVDLHALLLDVVSEKTGYPPEMLTLEMALEGDLGIDSIKRVEILSAMNDAVPGLPEVDTAAMAKLQTLGEVVDYMNGLLGSAGAVAPAAPQISAPSNDVDLHALLLDVVSEKTGYPPEMLTLEMALEGDLGIDSIKRVEILSAMNDAVPGLPEVDTAAMAKLQTLGEVVDYMNGLLAGPGAQVPVETTGSATVAPELDLSLGRFTLEAVPRPALGLALAGLYGGGPIAVTREGSDLADRLVCALEARGVEAVSVEAADLASANSRGVIFLGGLRSCDSDEAAIAVNREAFAAARAVAPSYSQAPAHSGIFVTLQDTGGAFGAREFDSRQAWLAGCAGLTRTVAQEWPAISARAIDLERAGRSSAVLAEVIATELCTGGADLDVGLDASGRRVVLESQRVEVVCGSPVLSDGDVVVASGGARGVTAKTMIALAGEARLRFVLLGRTSLSDEPACCIGVEGDATLKRELLARAVSLGEKLTPAELGKQVSDILAAREVRTSMAEIEKAGSEVRYVAADVTSRDSLGRALASVRQDWGDIAAIVHGAGVIADKVVAEKTDDQFDRVFDTKVEGLRALLSATHDDPIKLLCFFSSVAARCGNVGQCDYAMANEILNKVAIAEARRRDGACLVKSLGWGPWEGGMVSPQLKAHFESLGVPMIPLEVGARMLVDEVRGSAPQQVELVLGGEPRPEALNPAEQGRGLTLAVAVDRHSHPYLLDHAIGGTPVVPVAMAIEWLSRAARAFSAKLSLSRLVDLKVLRGISLQDFSSGRKELLVHCRQLSNGQGATLSLEISDAAGTLYYRSTAEMVEGLPPHDSSPAASGDTELGLEDWGDRVIYDGQLLFHGPDFQMIRNIDGISSKGMVAKLSGLEDVDWSPGTTADANGSGAVWSTDPRAFDGGLQMALLWCQRVLGGASLPTGIGEVRQLSEAPASGAIHCTLIGRSASGQKSVSDLVFRDDAGRLLAELNQVETHLLPSSGSSSAQD